MKHTPGPWKVHRYVTPGEFVTDTCIRASDESYLAKIGPVNIEANAALIAEAPNLLALVKLRADFEGDARWITNASEEEREKQRILLAGLELAGIARAEGREF